MKLIDKDALVAEINELKKEVGDDEYWNGYDTALDEVLYFIDTLEVKEINVNKEIEDFKEKIIKSSKAYRAYREECGIKDPILLDEVEEAYYAAYEQCYKDNVKSHREYYQKLDCGKWQTTTK